MKKLGQVLVVFLLLSQSGCATNTKSIATGMLVGALGGAAVGYQFVHHGQNKEFETRNTIISSVVFALATGGIMAWHYREIEQAKVEVSGRYARYRLCDPQDMTGELAKQLGLEEPQAATHQLQTKEIGKLAISLDDSTKWALPSFRKRYLRPERGETQVLSERYIWEIAKPGSFVTRSQNPEYFLEQSEESPK